LKAVSKISTNVTTYWQTISVLITILTAGAGFIIYENKKEDKTVQKVMEAMAPKFEEINNNFNQVDKRFSKFDLQFKFLKERWIEQNGQFNTYRLSKAKNETEQNEILKQINEQLERQRNEFMFLPTPILNNLENDTTLKKKLNSLMTASGS
jgi:predicted  nucleic acid-binding Zn-ribbon protein